MLQSNMKILSMKHWKGACYSNAENVQWDWCQVRSNMNENMTMQGYEAIRT